MNISINLIRKNILLVAFLLAGVHAVADDTIYVEPTDTTVVPRKKLRSTNNTNGLTADKLLPQFANLSPEAASLGRYGAFQVSEYSGAANISIPLYEVKSGDVSFPISLYYDASGIKVEQDATFVGLGWNLSYGGMISHIVCGNDDFQNESTYRNTTWTSFWESCKSLPKDQPCQTYRPVSVEYVGAGNDWGPWKENESNLYGNMSKGFDTPDVFQGNFCGHRISFIIDPRVGKGSDGQDSIVVLNDDPSRYKISYTTGRFGGFTYPSTITITDDKGITYVFSAYTEHNFSPRRVDSYYLTKIYGPDGENGKSAVTIEYEQIHVAFGYKSRPYSKTHQATARRIYGSYDNIPNTENFSLIFNNLLSSFYSSPEIDCGENGSCNRVYPTKITTALDVIEFSKGTRPDIPDLKSISGITVKSKSGSIQRTIGFTYGYYNEKNHDSSYSGKRLKLTALAIDDQKYSFEYDSQDLPAFTSFSKDYWGYYNGANTNAFRFDGCSPAYIISGGVVMPVEHLDGSNRLASERLCGVGMLNKIVYPTGGYTLYEYEIHRFNDKYYYPDAAALPSFTSNNTATPTTTNTNGGYSIGGGMRIKTIKNYDLDGTFLHGASYKYTGGKLLSPTVQLEKHYIEFAYKNPSGLGNDDRYPSVAFYYASTEPSYLFACSLGLPATVGYDTVEKDEIDGSGNVLRKTIYDFHNYGYISNDGNTNAINSRMQNSFFFNSYYDNNKGYLNGKLKKETRYSDTGSTMYIADYTYASEKLGSVLFPKCIPTHLPGFKLAAERYDLAFYRKFFTWSYPTSKSETFYNSSGSTTESNTTTYSYNSQNYQLAEQTVGDGLNTTRTCFWYSTDGKSSGTSYLTSKHNLTEVTGIDTYKNSVFVGGSKYNYTANNGIPVVSTCYSILPNSSKTNVLEMSVVSYDGYGNIREYQKKNGTPVTIIWSYNHQLPVMEIVGKTYNEVKNASSTVANLESSTDVSASTLKSLHATLRSQLSDAYVTAISYNQWHQVSCIVNPNGYETNYSYSFGRLTQASDASGAIQKYTYNYKQK